MIVILMTMTAITVARNRMRMIRDKHLQAPNPVPFSCLTSRQSEWKYITLTWIPANIGGSKQLAISVTPDTRVTPPCRQTPWVEQRCVSAIQVTRCITEPSTRNPLGCPRPGPVDEPGLEDGVPIGKWPCLTRIDNVRVICIYIYM